MGWDGLGTFEEPDAPQFPAISGDLIRADYYNAVIRAICEGFSNTLPRNGEAPATGDIDLANLYKVINAAPAVANGQLVRFQEFAALEAIVDSIVNPVEPFLYKNAGVI